MSQQANEPMDRATTFFLKLVRKIINTKIIKKQYSKYNIDQQQEHNTLQYDGKFFSIKIIFYADEDTFSFPPCFDHHPSFLNIRKKI